MTISLYDATVASFLQTLGGMAGFLERGRVFCESSKLDSNELVGARLHPEMLPFRYQVQASLHHSLGAINGVKAGIFSPPSGLQELDYAGLQAQVSAARTALGAITRDEVESLQGKDIEFRAGEFKMTFTAEDFLLSFSLPNFYFHATTAYDILRMKGVPVGKRDYLGQMRMKS